MNDFIEQYDIEQKHICDNLIKYFWERQDEHGNGVVASTVESSGVDKEVKDTTDLSLSVSRVQMNEVESNLFYPIFYALMSGLEMYFQKYPVLESTSYEISENFNLQHYKKGQHFKKTHFESAAFQHRRRMLVWMVYLNDVENGGETCFPYLGAKFQPQKGKLLLWPAEFTHAHFGDIVEDEKVYPHGMD